MREASTLVRGTWTLKQLDLGHEQGVLPSVGVELEMLTSGFFLPGKIHCEPLRNVPWDTSFHHLLRGQPDAALVVLSICLQCQQAL